MKSTFIRFEQLMPGMVFIDAVRPTQRLVILKTVPSQMVVWVVKIGFWQPYPMRNLSFYATRLTAHNKPRKGGYYLDPDIPHNVPDHLREPH